MDINTEIEKILLHGKKEKVSLAFLALSSLSTNLRTTKLEPKVVNALLVRGDEQIKSCLAQNPHISRSQWLDLMFHDSSEVAFNAKMNISHDISEHEANAAFLKRRAHV